MCFSNDDYDWQASVVASTDVTAKEPDKCDECGRTINVGEFMHTVYMQEHEECQRCENCECECVDCENKGCQCEKPEFGETFDYDRCEECDKFLQAIAAAEIEEGCDADESRPGLPMCNDLWGIGRQGCKRYWRKAVEMFPEHKAHFAMLWRRMF